MINTTAQKYDNPMVNEKIEKIISDLKINHQKMLAAPYNKRVAIFCVNNAEFRTFHIKGNPTIPILVFNNEEEISLKSLDDTKHLFKDNYSKKVNGVTMEHCFPLANAFKIINSFVHPVLVKNEGKGWHLEEAKSTIDWKKLTPFVKNRI